MNSLFIVGCTPTETVMMPTTATRAALRTTRAMTGLTSLPSSPCSKTSTCLLSSHASQVHAMSLSDPYEDDDCDIAGLLGRLNDTMVAYRPGFRDYLKNALIPTVHHQTRLHNGLRDKIDTSFATGVLSIDQVCKNVEVLRLKDEDDVTHLYSEVKVRAYTQVPIPSPHSFSHQGQGGTNTHADISHGSRKEANSPGI